MVVLDDRSVLVILAPDYQSRRWNDEVPLTIEAEAWVARHLPCMAAPVAENLHSRCRKVS